MRSKNQDQPKKGAPAYMNTYGDMMTLLLCFFVLLFSMSTVDAAKFKAFIESFSGSTGLLEGGEVILTDEGMLGNGIKQFPTEKNRVDAAAEELEDELNSIKESFDEFVSKEYLEESIHVEKKGDAIIIRFKDALLFETAKADIKPAAVPVLSKVGEEVKKYIDEGYHIKLEGHTDNLPIQTAQFPSNWELSAARSIAVAKFFIEEMDFSPLSVSQEGFGEYMPIGDNTTEEGRAKNRRVEIKLTKKK